jgi:hypothetical protein
MSLTWSNYPRIFLQRGRVVIKSYIYLFEKTQMCINLVAQNDNLNHMRNL